VSVIFSRYWGDNEEINIREGGSGIRFSHLLGIYFFYAERRYAKKEIIDNKNETESKRCCVSCY
jgi:hypothetical protein